MAKARFQMGDKAVLVPSGSPKDIRRFSSWSGKVLDIVDHKVYSMSSAYQVEDPETGIRRWVPTPCLRTLEEAGTDFEEVVDVGDLKTFGLRRLVPTKMIEDKTSWKGPYKGYYIRGDKILKGKLINPSRLSKEADIITKSELRSGAGDRVDKLIRKSAGSQENLEWSPSLSEAYSARLSLLDNPTKLVKFKRQLRKIYSPEGLYRTADKETLDLLAETTSTKLMEKDFPGYRRDHGTSAGRFLEPLYKEKIKTYLSTDDSKSIPIPVERSLVPYSKEEV